MTNAVVLALLLLSFTTSPATAQQHPDVVSLMSKDLPTLPARKS